MGVLVVGMHRSGTSALAGALRCLGLFAGEEAALIGASAANPNGHHELRALVYRNEMLLKTLGGTWSAPPPFDPVRMRELASTRTGSKSAAMLEELLPAGRRWVWKDPRVSLLLPFWRSVLSPPMAAVMVVRPPEASARSLTRRNGTSADLGVSLWMHYNLAACHGLRSVPTYLVQYGQLMADPRGTMASILELLEHLGVGPDGPDLAAAADSVEQRPTRSDPRPDPSPRVTRARELHGVLARAEGPHPEGLSVQLPEFPREDRVLFDSARAEDHRRRG